MSEEYQVLIDALQALYPEEIEQFKDLWRSEEQNSFLLQLVNRAVQDGYVGVGKDSLTIYKEVGEKRYGVTDAEAHSATRALSIDQTIKGSMRWTDDELKNRLNEIINDLRTQKRYQHKTAKEMWPSLLQRLEQAELLPEENVDTEDFRKSYVTYGSPGVRTNLSFSFCIQSSGLHERFGRPG